jgi:hypothetical protein
VSAWRISSARVIRTACDDLSQIQISKGQLRDQWPIFTYARLEQGRATLFARGGLGRAQTADASVGAAFAISLSVRVMVVPFASSSHGTFFA